MNIHLHQVCFLKPFDRLLKMLFVSQSSDTPDGEMGNKILAVACKPCLVHFGEDHFGKSFHIVRIFNTKPDHLWVVTAPENSRFLNVYFKRCKRRGDPVQFPANDVHFVFGDVTEKLQGKMEILRFNPFDVFVSQSFYKLIINIQEVFVGRKCMIYSKSFYFCRLET